MLSLNHPLKVCIIKSWDSSIKAINDTIAEEQLERKNIRDLLYSCFFKKGFRKESVGLSIKWRFRN